ncbi:unnamed protein product [Rotaria socialis]|uniref:HAT C-terminal dimerisation domain-containing protein n=2 Tax=Rotaria socialis TaxID=392032 RepID=A0A820QJ85_9BILA|nr:unnamed protein product [Rotaria socialis]
MWDELERRMKKEKPKNATELKHTLSRVWQGIGADVTKKLVDSVPNRLNEDISRFLSDPMPNQSTWVASQDDSSEDDEDEIERYAKAKLVISNEEYVLQWWKKWSINYPTLSVLVGSLLVEFVGTVNEQVDVQVDTFIEELSKH